MAEQHTKDIMGPLVPRTQLPAVRVRIGVGEVRGEENPRPTGVEVQLQREKKEKAPIQVILIMGPVTINF